MPFTAGTAVVPKVDRACMHKNHVIFQGDRKQKEGKKKKKKTGC